MILSVLNFERRTTIDRIVEFTNLSENKVRSAIENMLELGLIEASGKGKDRTYIMGKKIYRENKKTIQYVRQTDIDSIRHPEMVMKLAETQNGVITKQDIVELLKVTPVQAYAVIKKLQKEGKLELLCGGKYSKYKKVD
jgi:ATP-dependent DNA helicase RecG